MSPILKRVIGRTASVILVLGVATGCVSSRHGQSRPSSAPAPASGSVPPAATASSNTNGFLVNASRPAPPAAAANNMASNLLAWDSLSKEYDAKAGETNADFTFNLTNVSPQTIVIYDTSTTCDCTVAKLPARPWVLQPAATGQIHASLDLIGKTGVVTNYVIVFTSKGNRMLTVKADVPRH